VWRPRLSRAVRGREGFGGVRSRSTPRLALARFARSSVNTSTGLPVSRQSRVGVPPQISLVFAPSSPVRCFRRRCPRVCGLSCEFAPSASSRVAFTRDDSHEVLAAPLWGRSAFPTPWNGSDRRPIRTRVRILYGSTLPGPEDRLRMRLPFKAFPPGRIGFRFPGPYPPVVRTG
jgi:hypothetical protein